jgi:hypothetical protein
MTRVDITMTDGRSVSVSVPHEDTDADQLAELVVSAMIACGYLPQSVADALALATESLVERHQVQLRPSP